MSAVVEPYDQHGRLDRSDVERLVTIETVLKAMSSTLTSIKVDLRGDSDLLHSLMTKIERLRFDIDAERQARVDLIVAMNKRFDAIEKESRENTRFRVWLLAGWSVVAGFAVFLLTSWEKVVAFLRGGA